ncbi:Uncharacterized protein FWK35_00009451, partial [Aphis craccivora]
MLCVFFFFFFFVSVYSTTSRNNAPISNFGGGSRCKSEYSWCIIVVISNYFPTVFKKIEKKNKKNDGKTGIFTQNQFSTESIFLYGCNSKTNPCKYFKFSLNLKIHKICCRNDNDLSSNVPHNSNIDENSSKP